VVGGETSISYLHDIHPLQHFAKHNVLCTWREEGRGEKKKKEGE
jgi:hypothetical protein